jgi:hypothetical protein
VPYPVSLTRKSEPFSPLNLHPKSIQNQHTTIEALLSTTPFLHSGRWLLCGLSDFSATRQVIATYKLLVTRVRLPAVFELSKYRSRVGGACVDMEVVASIKPVSPLPRNVSLRNVAVEVGNMPMVAPG